MNGVAFGILGPLLVGSESEPAVLRGARQREVLALLLLRLGEVVSRDAIVEELWESEPPDTAVKVVQNAVSATRKILPPGATLRTEAGGYVLDAEADSVDARRFERQVGAARAALTSGEPATAREILREALALWRGQALADFAYARFAQAEIARLEDLRLAALEDVAEADLALGRHAEAAVELEGLVKRHPLRERLRAHLMLALYRSGRQADALALYQQTRALLVEELGIEPSPMLQRLERDILRQAPELETTEAAETVPSPAPRPVRKTVTVVVAEVLPFEPLVDPERRAGVVEPALAQAADVFEEHGSAVRRLPSASVLAVFGVPEVREDDALRAARAALELRVRMAGNAAASARVGVATGEVVAEGEAVSGEVLATAAQLQQRAAEGEILVSARSERLLRTASTLQSVRGEEPAWRLLDVKEDAVAIPRRLEAPLVGRQRELEQLSQALERVRRTRSAYLFTVFGLAGIGKSRLAAEFAAAASQTATVLTGRCVSYGQGITYWPLREMLRTGLASDVLAAEVAADKEAVPILNRVAGAIGAASVVATPAETFWAVRRLFETIARRRPLVAIVDDIHWAEPAFLDLVEYLTEWTRDAPLLLICLARTELLDARPSWGGGKLNATTLLLEPLSVEETDEFIDSLPGGRDLTDSTRARLADAAEGNPLFLEQTLALLREEGHDAETPPVPPTIHGLLEARLDRLSPGERTVLERASVIGRDFRRTALAELTSELPFGTLDEHLASLVRKDLLQPERGARDDGFRFRHSLIRAVAYESVPKRERARLHELFAESLERVTADTPPERLQLVGYHLERAFRYCDELDPDAATTRLLALHAAARLGEAGRRTLSRGDLGAAGGLLERAIDVSPPEEPSRLELVADLADALRETGDFARVEELLRELSDTPAARTDRRLQSRAALIRLRSQLQTDPNLDAEALHRAAEDVIAALAGDDDVLLAKAWELLAWAPWLRGQVAEAEAALRRSIEYARRAQDRRIEAQSLNLLVGVRLYGPAPVSEGIELCESIVARPDEQQRVRVAAMRALGALRAMQGDFDRGRAFLIEQRAMLEDLGLTMTAASTAETFGFVELLADRPDAAERELLVGARELERAGETSNLSNIFAMLAQAVLAQGRVDEAFRYTQLSERASAEEDLSSQVQWRAARAKVLAELGRREEAEALARGAVERAARTDFLILRADALVDLGHVLRGNGHGDGIEAVREAIDLYER
ncbi:MAG TPA: BTAD domain-containing putative transcriptional regulator, partial [Gaiellaceae bacterium]